MSGVSRRALGARPVRFALVGAWCTIADVCAYLAAVALGLAPAPSNVLAFLFANAQGYALNARFTFRQEGRSAPVSLSGYGRFLAAYSIGLLVATALIAGLAPRFGPIPAKGVAVLASLVLNYQLAAHFAFARPPVPPRPDSEVESKAESGVDSAASLGN